MIANMQGTHSRSFVTGALCQTSALSTVCGSAVTTSFEGRGLVSRSVAVTSCPHGRTSVGMRATKHNHQSAVFLGNSRMLKGCADERRATSKREAVVVQNRSYVWPRRLMALSPSGKQVSWTRHSSTPKRSAACQSEPSGMSVSKTGTEPAKAADDKVKVCPFPSESRAITHNSLRRYLLVTGPSILDTLFAAKAC